ncbi:MAG: hypothetical protein VB876_09595, partial [Pirellulales bacterium]
MPATEQTCRSMKRMHLVFAVSSIALFVSTIWVLAADHYREWKGYQTKYRQIENWSLAARASEQQTLDYEHVLVRLESAVVRARVSAPSAGLV